MFSYRRYLKRKKNSNGKEVGQSDTVTHIYEDIENGNMVFHNSQIAYSMNSSRTGFILVIVNNARLRLMKYAPKNITFSYGTTLTIRAVNQSRKRYIPSRGLGIIIILSKVRLWFRLIGHDEVAVVKPEFPSKVEDDIGVFTEPISKLPEKDYSTTPKIEPEVDNDKTVKTEETVGPTVTGESVPALPMYDEHIYGNEDPLERPIPVNQLASYIDDMASGVKGFAEEFAVSFLGIV